MTPCPRVRLLLALACAFFACMCVLAPAGAIAAEPPYSVSAFECGSWGAGQADSSGTSFVACGKTIRRYALDGTALGAITTAAYVWDVAPSPDASILYTFQIVGPGSRSEIRRLLRQADGSYGADATWRPAPFDYFGTPTTPTGRFLHTDAWGNLYVSNGSWHDGEPNTIIVYNPDGTVRTRFGDWAYDAGCDCSPNGMFRVNMGIATTRDGHSLYTIEHSNGRVQRFAWTLDHYEFAQAWGQTDSTCLSTGNFAAPYDIGVDPWGYVYVMDTGCGRVQKFTSAGTFLHTTSVNGGDASRKGHALAVDAHGDVFVPQLGVKISRTTPEPGSWPALVSLTPDTTRPTIAAVVLPARTVSRTVSLRVYAKDDVAVVAMRTRNGGGSWGGWRSFRRPVGHRLPSGYGLRRVFVQVRDAIGNVSTARYDTTRRVR